MHTHRENTPHRNGEEGQQNSYRRPKTRCLLLFGTVNLVKANTFLFDLLSVLFYST